MTIPARLQPPPVSQQEIRDFCRLCNAIEDGVNRSDDVTELMDRWNRRASRRFEPHEFTTYAGAVSTEHFVEEALLPAPPYLQDITFDEMRSVLEAVVEVTVPGPQHSYFLGLLEENLPGSGISDLIYWPNVWFKDEALLHADLTADQTLMYAVLRCGRKLAGTPTDVTLPYPMPPEATKQGSEDDCPVQQEPVA
jgi:hypothetical protein